MCSPLTIAGQEPTSLQTADQAFADTLKHHDRAALRLVIRVVIPERLGFAEE
jgi:hypothetical protein